MWTDLLLRLGFADYLGLRVAGSLAISIGVQLGAAGLLGFRTRRDLSALALVNVVTVPALVLSLVGADLLLVRMPTWWVFAWLPFIVGLAAGLAAWRLLAWASGRPSREALRVVAWANLASFSACWLFWAALSVAAVYSVSGEWTGLTR